MHRVSSGQVGKGAGPVVIAALIHALGRPSALALSMLGWMPCAILCGCTSLTVVADEMRMAKLEDDIDERKPLMHHL